MAAFCGCCGAEITAKAEACLVCGTPRHGMMPSDVPFPFEAAQHSLPEAESPLSCESKAAIFRPAIL